MRIINNFISQTVFMVGVILVFGLVIALCRRVFCKLVGSNKILLITGIMGTPIHELSHAAACIIFRHKIIEIKLYQPTSNDGTLGYVNHRYNPKNIYHQIGNFFIGIAPIILGSTVLLLLMRLLVPSTYSEIRSEMQFIEMISFNLFDMSTYMACIDIFWDLILILFDFTNIGNIFWWIFIILGVSIASHMELSLADIKGSLKGLVCILILLLIIDIILFFININYLETLTSNMLSSSMFIASFLAISILFSGILVLLGLIIKLAKKFLKRNK